MQFSFSTLLKLDDFQAVNGNKYSVNGNKYSVQWKYRDFWKVIEIHTSKSVALVAQYTA